MTTFDCVTLGVEWTSSGSRVEKRTPADHFVFTIARNGLKVAHAVVIYFFPLRGDVLAKTARELIGF
ncbi:MAG: hypothetical protein ABL985_13065 [Casimicrobium sp.]